MGPILVVVAVIVAPICIYYSCKAIRKNDTSKVYQKVSNPSNTDAFQFCVVQEDELADLKIIHDKVEAAINSYNPDHKKPTYSMPITEIDPNDAKMVYGAKTLVITQICRDLECEKDDIPNQLMNQINDLFSWASIGANYKNLYFECELSSKSGGQSNIRIGLIGAKKVPIVNKMIIGCCLYFKSWKEKQWVKLNLEHEIWARENIKKFAKYMLYTEVGKEFKARCKQLISHSKNSTHNKLLQESQRKILSERNDELYLWLNGLNLMEYYDNFHNEGHDDKAIIKEINIQNNDELKELGIIKRGHLRKLKIAIKKLKEEFSDDLKPGFPRRD